MFLRYAEATMTSEAVRALRQRLGLTQQSFATRLGLSIRAVANYEKDRVPAARILSRLASVSQQEGHSDLKLAFMKALFNQIAAETASGTYEEWARRETEKIWCEVVVVLLRDPEFVSLRYPVSELLMPVIEKVASRAEAQYSLEVFLAFHQIPIAENSNNERHDNKKAANKRRK
jgi:transcriptional regulator with XRE-family HTH domain